MKKVIALLSIAGLLAFSNFNGLKAQEQTPAAEATEQTTDSTAATVDSTAEEATTPEVVAAETTEEVAPLTFHQVLKQKYIQGGAGWMTPILLCLLFGLALVIERVLYLNLATTNVEKLLASIEENVKKGDYNAAVRAFGEAKTNNAALAQIMVNDYNKARTTLAAIPAPDATTYYLLAVLGARTNNVQMVTSNLRQSFRLDANMREAAAKDLEFAKFNLSEI